MVKCFVVLLPLCGLAAFGQDSVGLGMTGASSSFGSAHFGPPPASVRAVTGAPYCGELVSGNVQTLADGTHLTRDYLPTKTCRDSFGRTRSERPAVFRDTEDAPSTPVIVEITDPVAGVRYVLDTQGKIAHRQMLSSDHSNRLALHKARDAAPLPAGAQSAHIETVTRPDPKAPQTTTEKLEAQVIEGVLAEGQRTTTTWPEGSHMGNDRPFSVVTESWRSPELHELLLSKRVDPRSGEHTQKMTNLTRTEPDPALFQPPPDYTIVDEKEDFTIKWTSGPR